MGENATRRVLREQGHGSRFVHIAARGIFRSDNPMFSSIRLGDGHLSLFDLYDLPLSAELVTLSGCSTGLNVVVGGDELFGLMRGLLSAGAHSILVSLWDVFDRSTAAFMTSFYRHLRNSRNKAQAVREANARGTGPVLSSIFLGTFRARRQVPELIAKLICGWYIATLREDPYLTGGAARPSTLPARLVK